MLDKETEKPLEALITYNDLLSDDEIGTASSDPTSGEYKIVLPYGRQYSFRAMRKKYYPVSENLDVSNITAYQEIERDLYLSPIKVGETVRLNNIFFDTDKATLKETSYAELNRLVQLLKDNGKMKIDLGGHTDSQGNEAYNQQLSDGRVKTVIQYLVESGIAAKRLTGKGYGESKPVASNDTPEGRALNRRAEFTILEVK